MSTTIDALTGVFDTVGLTYETAGDNTLRLRFTTQHYEEPRTGNNSLLVLVRLAEKGRFLSLLAPRAFLLEGPNVAAALETCMRFQWDYRLIRFEYGASDGELRPSIHVPLFDAELGVEQLKASCGMLVDFIERIGPAIIAALSTGSVFAQLDELATLTERLAGLRPHELELLLAAVRTPEEVRA